MAQAIQVKFRVNTISPTLAMLARGVSNKTPILEAMGTALVSYTKRTFNDASLRAAPWPARKNTATRDKKGKFVSQTLLKKTGALWQSIRITQLSTSFVAVGSDRPYAAVHQFGSRKKTGRGGGIPARPFFPFLSGKLTPGAEKSVVAAGTAKIAALAK